MFTRMDFLMNEVTNTGVITLTLGAYNDIQGNAALDERQRIIDWLRSAQQPMTHTAWALAKAIEEGKHYD